MQNKSLNIEDVQGELKSSFPGVRTFVKNGEVHLSVYSGTFTDGKDLFSWFDGENYDGGIHDGFTQWLEDRGWYLENHDGEAMVLQSLESARILGAY